ncbi:hypothetical protein GCM10025882_31860 [Acinetobacter gyllenbergii]|uniref:Uncharacterized protein n=1 Tax=Acinetobacter gyllenbergii CIP 110306 = MTCC 11365 TaxID=1217657 RepID=A0A829HC71_9GAMM|nr:hypothetical protein [Acinetobacter gyllenbergii]EPF72560.1 hypothetical protein F957_03696 [Acinetobacter gyllenbergii CIP 110306 = MTCC 11365]EPH31085.1 hypothetical protein L293_2488 [Acinetobacter gyllenbergii CIP 110306 = MTCC 11365]GMA12761.1 hypothetical protein GCM10025882_31860 [Acinetobacter gyllenbergii]
MNIESLKIRAEKNSKKETLELEVRVHKEDATKWIVLYSEIVNDKPISINLKKFVKSNIHKIHLADGTNNILCDQDKIVVTDLLIDILEDKLKKGFKLDVESAPPKTLVRIDKQKISNHFTNNPSFKIK